MLESKFQSNLIRTIKQRFPGAIIFKTDANYIQGFPDLMVLYRNHWAALECKREALAHRQPNQEYYVNQLDSLSFARFIYPENMEVVLDEMERSFESG